MPAEEQQTLRSPRGSPMSCHHSPGLRPGYGEGRGTRSCFFSGSTFWSCGGHLDMEFPLINQQREDSDPGVLWRQGSRGQVISWAWAGTDPTACRRAEKPLACWEGTRETRGRVCYVLPEPFVFPSGQMTTELAEIRIQFPTHKNPYANINKYNFFKVLSAFWKPGHRHLCLKGDKR